MEVRSCHFFTSAGQRNQGVLITSRLSHLAITYISLLIAETQLQEFLGEPYIDKHWWIALTAIMNVEGYTTQAAATVVKRLAAAATHHTGLTIKIPLSQPP